MFTIFLKDMIRSFSCGITEKVFKGETLKRKEVNTLGDCNLQKARERLEALNIATENDLRILTSFHYHRIRGTDYFSIDTKRNSAWRILFQWDDDEMKDVKLVKLTTETHR